MRTIIVGLDGSDGAARALRWATGVAQDTGAELLAVHVLTYSNEFVHDLPPMGFYTWRRDRVERLDGPWTAPARRAGVKVRTALVEDESPAAGLRHAAADEHADLVVVGTRGHSGLADRLLASTSRRLGHHGSIPVVVVPPGWSGDGGGNPLDAP